MEGGSEERWRDGEMEIEELKGILGLLSCIGFSSFLAHLHISL